MTTTFCPAGIPDVGLTTAVIPRDREYSMSYCRSRDIAVFQLHPHCVILIIIIIIIKIIINKL